MRCFVVLSLVLVACGATAPSDGPPGPTAATGSSSTADPSNRVSVRVISVTDGVDLGFQRWVTVSLPGDKTREILLEVPGRPAMDDKTAEQVRDLVTKGSAGGQLVFATDDCRKTYEALRARGVEFTMEPTERPYGIDCGLRDPFGNLIRFSQTTSKP